MTIHRTDVAARMEYMVRTGFVRAQNAYTPKRAPFCGTTQSTGAFETYSDMFTPPWPGNSPNGGMKGSTGIDGRTNAQRTGGLHDGEDIKIYEAGENPAIVYNNDWPMAIGITHNAINDDRVGDLATWASGVATRYEQHKDYLAFQALNNGDTDEWGVGTDGLTFFNANHVTPGAAFTTAQSNLPAGAALDLTSYDAAVTLGGDFRDEWGQPAGLSHEHLVVAHDLRMAAAQVVGAIVPEQSANVNPYMNGPAPIIAPGGYLDTGTWFTVDTSLPQKPVVIQERMSPQLVIEDDNFRGMGVRYFIWQARYTVFYGDWRLAIKGN